MASSYRISDKNLKKVWLVLSKDAFAATENLHIIENICRKNGIDYDSTSYFEIGKFDWNDAAELAGTPSFFGERLIVVEGGDITALNEEDFKGITRLIDSLTSNHRALIFTYEDEKKLKAKKYETLFTLVKNSGLYHFIGDIDEKYLQEMIISRAKSLSTELPKDVAKKIVENIGKDVGLISNEVDKYCAACGYTEITAEIVDRIGVKSVEASVFDMIDLICRKRPAKAIEKLNNLFALRTDEMAILGALTSGFVDMHRCKAGEAKRLSYTRVNKDFEKSAKPYRYQKAMSNASKFSLSALEEILQLLMKADIAAKSSRADKKQMLYVLTAQIISKGAGL